MPTLNEHHAATTVKLLLIGDSGSGKTGALASLVNNLDLELFILDFDNGLDILHQFIDKSKRSMVHYETLTDKMKTVPRGPPIPAGTPTAWAKAVSLLDKWKDGDEDYGRVTSWDASRVLVIDSLTMQGRAAMHYVKDIAGQPMERDWGFYGPAMEIQEKLLEFLYSDAISCHVIVMAHIAHITPTKRIETTNKKGEPQVQFVEAGDTHQYPSALGNKLPPKVGRFFNHILKVKTVANRRTILTQPMDELELKTTAPLNVKRELPLETGLADYFTTVLNTAKGENK